MSYLLDISSVPYSELANGDSIQLSDSELGYSEEYEDQLIQLSDHNEDEAQSQEGIFKSPKFIWKTARTVIRRLHSTICNAAVQL